MFYGRFFFCWSVSAELTFLPCFGRKYFLLNYFSNLVPTYYYFSPGYNEHSDGMKMNGVQPFWAMCVLVCVCVFVCLCLYLCAAQSLTGILYRGGPKTIDSLFEHTQNWQQSYCFSINQGAFCVQWMSNGPGLKPPLISLM